MRGVRQHGQRETQKPIGAEFEQHARQYHATRGRGLHVRVRQPRMERKHRHFHGKRGEEGPEQPGLQPGRILGVTQREDVEGVFPGVEIEHDNRHQQQDAAGQGIQEKLDGRVYAVGSAPDPDQQVHGDQHGFPEDVEQHEVQRDEHAECGGFHDEQADHEFSDARPDRGPGHQDAERRQQGGQQHQGQADPVHAHRVVDGGRCNPLMRFHELHGSRGFIEQDPRHERDQEHQRRNPQSHPFGQGFFDQQNRRHAQHGQKDDQGQPWESAGRHVDQEPFISGRHGRPGPRHARGTARGPSPTISGTRSG